MKIRHIMYMKVCLKEVNLMAKAQWNMLMEINIVGCGQKGENMVKEFILTVMANFMMEDG